MTIGQRIRQARKRAGMTQRKLAEKLGVTPQAVFKYENDMGGHKIETLKRIAAALNTDCYTLSGDVPGWGRWIPVTEDLPPIGKPVLITYIAISTGCLHSDGVAALTDVGWLWWDGTLAECDVPVQPAITHWMQLPACPEEGTQ